jgi:hypothetical protein
MKSLKRWLVEFLFLALIAPTYASSGPDYFKGKTITLIHGSAAGGTHDTQA